MPFLSIIATNYGLMMALFLQPDLRFAQSHEALLLRKALQNESSQEIFLSFLSVGRTSGSNCKADVEFWLEVQRFKVECLFLSL